MTVFKLDDGKQTNVSTFINHDDNFFTNKWKNSYHDDEDEHNTVFHLLSRVNI